MTDALLKTITPDRLSLGRRQPVDSEAIKVAQAIIEDVEKNGEEALRKYAERFGEIPTGASLFATRDELEEALQDLEPADRELLKHTAKRINRFALAQKQSLASLEIDIPGGRAGHFIAPVERAGCYAPGGRFPLPSSALMTAVTAKAAGVEEVWVASPKPAKITLAAAAIADADGLLKAGGAQAIAAFTFGAGPIPACDAVVGPGNRFVTAAKKFVSGRVMIDMLAGPSELAIMADETANPAIIAADLLAQAEHDTNALPMLITTEKHLIASVNEELFKQLGDLPTKEIASAALRNGFSVLAPDLESAIDVCDKLAPEHLQLHLKDATNIARQCRHYGAIFIGQGAGESLGDYGAGPNHTLPTGGTARYTGGLSVFNFLRVRTWMRIDDNKAALPIIRDAERLAELEGLYAHARSAKIRE